MLHEIVIAFGANLGDRRATLQAARRRLAETLTWTACSHLYQTPPWGDRDQPPFVNAVCRGCTNLSPQALLALLKSVEIELGRVPSRRWGPRVIDLDILFYDDLVLHENLLTLPHPHLHERAFVLIPAHEIAPDLRHPRLGRTIAELVAAISAEGVQRLDEAWS